MPASRGGYQRIIPARAGFTVVGTTRAASCQDHPRSRGVYWYEGDTGNALGGSSPLARGLPTTPASTSRPARIIPARAGFTPSRKSSCHLPPDHPRSRGVYLAEPLVLECGEGSSPLARGLLVTQSIVTLSSRIIPARAGFTARRTAIRPGDPDHPRSRGVYFWTSNDIADLPRIIPARAGFTREGRGLSTL